MKTAQIRRIREGELGKLIELASADDHIVLYPTHVVEKDGVINGYLSIGSIPTVNLWLDSKQIHIRDTLGLLSQLDAIMDDGGIDTYYMPCDEKSPLYPHMQKFGFESVMKTVLFIRKLFKAG